MCQHFMSFSSGIHTGSVSFDVISDVMNVSCEVILQSSANLYETVTCWHTSHVKSNS